MKRGKDFLLDQLAKAEAAGHVLKAEPTMQGRQARVKTVCTCGWESRPRPTKRGAIGAAVFHLGELAGDGFPQLEKKSPDQSSVSHRVEAG